MKDFLIQPKKLQTRKSDLGGYGVFAAEDISEGEVVEEATFVRMKYRTSHVFTQEIEQICYPMPCSCDTCRIVGQQLCLSSGYIDLYNHGDEEEQNVRFDWQKKDGVIAVVSTKEIKKGQEVLHSYGSNYDTWGAVR